MGTATPHALGRNLKFFAKAETTFGTFVKPAATNAVKVKKTSFSFKQARLDRMDSRASRSLLERITDRKEVSWSCELYLIPSGTAGTAPDADEILKAAFGVSTNTPATSQAYTLSATQTALGSLSLVRQMNDTAMEAITGAWVEQCTLKLSGGDVPTLAFEGGAADLFRTGRSTTNGALSGGETTVTVQTADVANFEAGSVISVGSSTNHQVTSRASAVLTVTPAISGAQSDGVEVVPYVPSETVAGVPVPGILGSLTIDSTSIPITSFEVTLKNNIAPMADEAFSAVATDYIPGFREVTGTIGLRVRRDLFKYIAGTKLFATRALVVACGTSAGKILTVSIPYAELEFADIDVPEAEVAVINVPFRALGSSGEDELTLTFT